MDWRAVFSIGTVALRVGTLIEWRRRLASLRDALNFRALAAAKGTVQRADRPVPGQVPSLYETLCRA